MRIDTLGNSTFFNIATYPTALHMRV